MFLRKAVFERFHDRGCRDRTGHESDTNRLEWFRGKRLGSQSSPEAMPVSRHGCESGDSILSHKIINLTALDISRAVISRAKVCAESRISLARPLRGQSRRQVLWVST